MSTTTALVVVGGIAIFGLVAYLIVKQQSNSSAFGDLTGLLGSL